MPETGIYRNISVISNQLSVINYQLSQSTLTR